MSRIPRYRQPSLEQLEGRCVAFNLKCPLFTVVDYHPVIGEPSARRTRTRSVAYVLSGHSPVVFVEGVAGCVHLDAITIPQSVNSTDNLSSPDGTDKGTKAE